MELREYEQSFPLFLTELTRFMNTKKIDQDNIAYVNISSDYWMTSEDFFSLDKPPKIWTNFSKNGMNTWDIYSSFKVVMKDYSWIEYYECDDEFYSKFRFHEPVRRSKQRYYTIKKPHNRTLGDYMIDKKN